MNEPSRILPRTKGQKTTFRKAFQLITTSLLVLSLGMTMFLSHSGSPALAAPVPGIPTDNLTWVKTTDTSQFNTPNDPIDDSIEYTPTPGFIGDDSFTYQICDGTTPTPLCETALVSITVEAAPVGVTVSSPQILSANAIAAPLPQNDDVTMPQDTWVNIDVLANDSFGTGGPGTGPITIFPTCTTCTGPTSGTAKVNDGPRSPDPAGLAFLSYDPPPNYEPPAEYQNKLLISDSEVDEIFPPNPAAYAGVNLFLTDLSGAVTPTVDGDDDYYRLTTHNPPDIDFSREPSGVAYNPANGFLYFADDGRDKIHEVNPGNDGLYSTDDDIVKSFNSDAFGSIDPSGAAFDGRGNGHLFIADERLIPGETNEKDDEVYHIDLGTNGKLDLTDTVTHFDTAILGINNPEGVEFNPDNCTLFILSSRTADHRIAETTIDGHLLRYLEFEKIDGGENARNPAGLAYAPASGDPSKNNLYIVARGVDNDPPPPPTGSPIILGDPAENDGKMFEVTFEPGDRNAPPYVNAGPDQITSVPFFPNDINLDGTVTDGCSPALPGVTITWSVVEKPPGAVVNFGDASAVDTTANVSLAGEYTFQLEANDGAKITTDQVIVTVSLAVNQAPVVDAGPPQIITLPNDAILDGSATDDGLPFPPTLTTTWSVVGTPPGPVIFGDHTKPKTTASFTTPGIYSLQLTAHDTELFTSDFVTITVNAEGEQKVWLPLVKK
jgi:hypothetical protein